MIIALIITLLLLANALFVAAEFAIVGATRSSVEHQARGGDRMARRLLRVLTSPAVQDRYIATAQLGITLASLGLGMYGEHTLAVLIEARLPLGGWAGVVSSHAAASVLAIAMLTYLHIFIGEMVPKAIALSFAERTARFVHVPMQVTLISLYPFVVALNAIGNACLRLLGVRRQGNTGEQVYTPEELQIIVEESERGGALRAESGRLLRELFEFGELTAAEVMVPRVRIAGIPRTASPAEVKRIVQIHRRTRYPVYEGDLDHLVGMVHTKDLLRRLVANEPLEPTDVRAMPVVPETASLDDVLAVMQRARAHMAVVIDEHGGTAGILSLEDLFEEVVGELDEGVPTAPPLERIDDRTVRSAGTVRLDELGQFFGVDLEHDEVDSVSGLVLAELDRPPLVGDVVEYGPIRFEVVGTSGRGVREVHATLRPTEPSASPRPS
jgi:CBS domain containing-hemolysin-like protein